MTESQRRQVIILTHCPIDPNLGSGYIIHRTIEALSERFETLAYSPDTLLKWKTRKGFRTRCWWAILTRGLPFLFSKQVKHVVVFGGPAWGLVLMAWLLGKSSKVTHYSNGVETHAARAVEQFGCRRTGIVGVKRLPAFLFDVFQNLSFKFCRLIVVSNYERDWVKGNMGFEPLVVDNPIPDSFFADSGLIDRKQQILFASSFIDRKGARFFPEVLEVLEKCPDWSLIMIDCPIEHPQVKVLARQSKEELRQLYLSSRVVFAPSMYESFHLIVPEALASGCIVVTTPTGIANELDTNMVIAEFEVGSLKAALLRATEMIAAPVNLERFRESKHAARIRELFP